MAPGNREEKPHTRKQVEDLIAQGQTIMIVDGKVLRVDAWLPYHPGGDKAIRHMVGRDATDEVNALHSPEARRKMTNYKIGRVDGQWRNFVPPIQGGTFRLMKDKEYVNYYSDTHGVDNGDSSDSSQEEPVFDARPELRNRARASSATRSSSATSLSSLDPGELDEQNSPIAVLDGTTQKELDLDLDKYPSLQPDVQEDIVRRYRVLYDRIQTEGLFNCNYYRYGIEACRCFLLFGLFLAFLRLGWFGTSGIFLGMLWHQLVFTVHDAGHMGITHDFTTDTVIGILIADFIGGLSLGWWKRNHNVHHIVTNSPEHDPDIEHMPFFAISHRFFNSLKSSYYDRIMSYDPFAQFMIRYQGYLYYPILTFGRFNLYRLSWEYLILGQGPRKGPAWWHRWLEIAGQVFFWWWFGYGVLYKTVPTAWGRFAFVMVSHAITMPLHVQITLSHFAMSTSDLGVNESFPQKMLRTTMDVDCPEWLDFFHGGLQFQAIHHLFPRMPRHNLRRAQKLVQQFCDEVSIPYALYGFLEGNKQVVGRLADVGRQAAILAECQKAIAGKPLHDH